MVHFDDIYIALDRGDEGEGDDTYAAPDGANNEVLNNDNNDRYYSDEPSSGGKEAGTGAASSSFSSIDRNAVNVLLKQAVI